MQPNAGYTSRCGQATPKTGPWSPVVYDGGFKFIPDTAGILSCISILMCRVNSPGSAGSHGRIDG